MKYLLKSILILFCFCIKAQTANIRAVEQKGQKIYITYDLEGSPGKYNIKLFVKSNNSYSWSSALKSVSGNVGANQTVGSNKHIVWDVLSDRDKFEGDWVFGIEAINITEKERIDKWTAKQIKRDSKLYPSSLIAYSCNVTHNPFGITYFGFGYKSLVGMYFDIRTDFRVFAPGEWALRNRSWITGSMGGHDNGNDVISNGGNNLTAGIVIPIQRLIWSNLLLHLGVGISSIPVFDEFGGTFTGPYYARSHGINRANLNVGFVRQAKGGFNLGLSYDTASPGINLIIGGSI